VTFTAEATGAVSKDAVQGQPAKFIIQATGTEPLTWKLHKGYIICLKSLATNLITDNRAVALTYQWQWKPAEEEGGGVEWQPCPAEWCDSAAILIPMEKSSEGSYHCVVSNCAGRQTSEPAKLNEVSYCVSDGHLMCMKYASCARQIE